MRHAVRHFRIPLVGEHRFAGQPLHGGRRDEVASRLSHRDLHLHALLHQQAQQLRRLVGRNAAGDAQHNAFYLSLFHNAVHLIKKQP